MLEYDYPTYSIFSNSSLPLPNPLPSSSINSIILLAQYALSKRPPTNTSAAAKGGISFLAAAAAGDPASLGVAVLLANASTGNGEVNGVGYGDAARDELEYLLNDVPKVSQTHPIGRKIF